LKGTVLSRLLDMYRMCLAGKKPIGVFIIRIR